MDVSNVSNAAPTMPAGDLQTTVSIAMQKKANDIQASSISALISALPPVTKPSSLPSLLGQNIYTTA